MYLIHKILILLLTKWKRMESNINTKTNSDLQVPTPAFPLVFSIVDKER